MKRHNTLSTIIKLFTLNFGLALVGFGASRFLRSYRRSHKYDNFECTLQYKINGRL
ncbi:MAG: hypothetical protein LBP59_09690 [Planctomycetaceae bacterium]|nr:hypothetical protein [Planctomycetaceae bacterium]